MAVQTAQTPRTATIDFISIQPNYLRAKRAIDILFTLLIFIPLCILIAIVAVLIRLDSEGSIFYRQKRIGQNGVEFEMLKFRSMYENCDDTLHDVCGRIPIGFSRGRNAALLSVFRLLC